MSSFPVLLVLKSTLKPQELQDRIEKQLRSKFEIVPRGTKLIEKIHSRGDTSGVTVVYFTKLAIAELFIHIDIPVVAGGQTFQRMFENRDVPHFETAFSRMIASTSLIYVEGGGVSDVESHVQGTLEDAAHGQWTRRCSNNCWFMELASEELADLLVYRCNKQREGLFLFRSNVVVITTEVKPVGLACPEGRAEEIEGVHSLQLAPRAPDGSKQGDTSVHIQAPLPVTPLKVQVPNTHRDETDGPRRKPSASQTKLFLLVEMHTPRVDEQLALAIKEAKPVIKPRVSWIDNRMVNIEMGSEVEADRLMDVFLERTMEFFNDPPMRLFRSGFYRRPGRRFRHDWGDETEIIIEGFPRGIHHLPGKAAVCELLGRAIGATKTTVTNFYMRDETARVSLRNSSTVEDVLEHRDELVLCGRTLTVKPLRKSGRNRELPRENRVSRSNSRDRDHNRVRGFARSRSNSRERRTYSRRSRHHRGSSGGMENRYRRSRSTEPEMQREVRFSARSNEFNRHLSHSRRNAQGCGNHGRFSQDIAYEATDDY